MANRAIKKMSISKHKIMQILKTKGYSVRGLAHPQTGIGWSEKTIRRGLYSGFMTFDLVNDIAKHVGVKPNDFSDDSEWVNVGNRLKSMTLGHLRKQLDELVSFEQSDSSFEVLIELFGE